MKRAKLFQYDEEQIIKKDNYIRIIESKPSTELLYPENQIFSQQLFFTDGRKIIFNAE